MAPSGAAPILNMKPFKTVEQAASIAKSCPVHSHFSAHSLAPQHPLLAWRDRVGHVIDVMASRADIRMPFSASIDRYAAGDLAFTDCRSDAMWLERSLARISRDANRMFAFHVFLEGHVDEIAIRASQRDRPIGPATIIVLDLGQPIRMRRGACRVITYFVPATVAAEVFPDAEAIHGRSISVESPLTQLIVDHATVLSKTIGSLDAEAARSEILIGAQLITAALGRDAGLSGNARATQRAAMFSRARRYVQANLAEEHLSPESVVHALQLPRPSLYRLFQHEGGLGAYIRHLRLRHAADELVRCPHLSVTDIAYGLGFSSPSDFTRAFRRAYDIAPQDLRAPSGTLAAA